MVSGQPPILQRRTAREQNHGRTGDGDRYDFERVDFQFLDQAASAPGQHESKQWRDEDLVVSGNNPAQSKKSAQDIDRRKIVGAITPQAQNRQRNRETGKTEREKEFANVGISLGWP